MAELSGREASCLKLPRPLCVYKISNYTLMTSNKFLCKENMRSFINIWKIPKTGIGDSLKSYEDPKWDFCKTLKANITCHQEL